MIVEDSVSVVCDVENVKTELVVVHRLEVVVPTLVEYDDVDTPVSDHPST